MLIQRKICHTVCFGSRRHHNAADSGTVNTANFFKSTVVRAGVSEPVVCFTQTINRQLVFFVAICFQLAAYMVIQMKRISKNGKRYTVFMKQFQKPPKIRVQNRISSGYIEIWQTVIYLAKINAIIKSVLHLLPIHRIYIFSVISRKNITVLAPLITFVCNVPLKSEILFRLRKILLHFAYLALPFYKIGLDYKNSSPSKFRSRSRRVLPPGTAL